MSPEQTSRSDTPDSTDQASSRLERGEVSPANVEHHDMPFTAGDGTDIAMTRLSPSESSSNSRDSTKNSLLSPSVRETTVRDSSSISSNTLIPRNPGNLSTPDPTYDEKCSWIQTAIVLQSEQLSIGILGLSYVYAVFGLWVSMAGILWVHTVNYYGCKIMWQYVREQRACGQDVQDMDTFSRVLFSGRTKKAKVLRVFVGRAFDANALAVMSFHVLCTQFLIKHLSPVDRWAGCQSFSLGALATVICCLVCLCPLGRRATWLAGLSVLGMIIGLTLVLVDLNNVFVQPEALEPALGTEVWGGVPKRGWVLCTLGFLNLSFPLSISNTVPALVSEMRKSDDFLKSLHLSTCLSICLCFAFGAGLHSVVGYSFAPLLQALSGQPVSKAAVVAFMPSVIGLGALYAGFLVKSLIHRSTWLSEPYARLEHDAMITTQERSRWYKSTCRFLIKFGVAATVWLIALVLCNLIPFFELLTAFIAAIFNSLFGYILPAWVGIRLTPKDPRDRTRDVTYPVATFFIILGVFIFAIGTAAGVDSLMESFRTTSIAMPFSCAPPAGS